MGEFKTSKLELWVYNSFWCPCCAYRSTAEHETVLQDETNSHLKPLRRDLRSDLTSQNWLKLFAVFEVGHEVKKHVSHCTYHDPVHEVAQGS